MGNYLVYGEYPEDEGPNPPLFFPSGVIRGRDLTKVEKLDTGQITEMVSHSWYEYDGGDQQGLHPFQGETKPKYTGPKPPYERLDTAAKYSWLKSPRYAGLPMEVGPLSRMLVAYASGHPRVKELVGVVLQKLNVGPEALFSTLGRVAARAIETLVLAEKQGEWLDQLAANMARHDLRTHDNAKWDPVELAGGRVGGRVSRSAARGAGPLGPHPQRRHRQLPVHRAQHVERRAARRQQPARAVRGSPARHAGRRSDQAGRDPAHDPLVRSLSGLWRPRP